jgi:N,N'-diacetyllegionaminate synthase
MDDSRTTMKIGEFDLNEKIFVIAEIGNNHEGNVSTAEEMIGRAMEAGADAVKFQSIDPGQLIAPGETQRLAQLGRFRLSDEEYLHLARVAEREGVAFLSTPFFLDAVEFLDPLVPAFKIASGDNNFIPLLKAVAGTGKPILLSTGMSDLAGLKHGINAVRSAWKERGTLASPGLVLLHCVSAYPTFAADANIGFMRDLLKLGHTLGYSDHTIGADAVTLAVALGARVIEKHFTLDNNFSDFRDHQMSCNPEDMRVYCEKIRMAETLLGEGTKRLLSCEEETNAAARRTIVAARELPAGHVLKWDDLAWLRPDGTPTPGIEQELLGKRLMQPLSNGEPIKPECIR